MLDQARHERLESLFHAVLDVPLPERGEFVCRSCGADAELRTELEALLALDARQEGALDLDPPAPLAHSLRTLGTGAQFPLNRDPAARYRVAGEIGRGGMGIVLEGRDLTLGRDVALKVLRGPLPEGPALQRFVEEAQIGSQLQHPGIVPVYDLGARDGEPYFTMKLVEGRTLATLLRERQDAATERRRLLAIFEHVCQAVAYAHARGVVHRDLKPANVMVGAFGEVLVMDWGMAKVLARDTASPARDRAATQTVCTVRSDPAAPSGSRSLDGAIMGTPAYMPPEQAGGELERVDERADVFALGAILVEILTGRPPYEGSQAEQIDQATRALLDPVRQRLDACDADAELVAIAHRCLHADPGGRWRDAGALAEALAACFARAEERAQAAELTAVAERAKAVEARRAQRLTVALAATVLVAAGVAALGFFAVQGARERRLARAVAQIDRALEDTAQAVGEARSAAGHDAEPWSRARAIADRVGAIAAASETGDLTNERLARLRAEIEAGEAAARVRGAALARDRTLRAELPEIAIPQVVTFELANERLRDARRRDAGYTRAFQDYGIDVDALTPEAAAGLVRASAIAGTLTDALDDWGAARGLVDADPKGRVRLWSIARDADPDPWRRGVREQIIGLGPGAKAALLETGAAASDLPPASARLLAIGLELLGERALSLRVLRSAHIRHPSDFLIALYLGMRHECAVPRAWREALPAYSVAAALRPDSAMASFRLAMSQWQTGDAEAACGSYRRVIALRPEFEPSRVQLARVLNHLRRPEAALEVLDPILRRTDSAFAAHALAELGHAQQLTGDLRLAAATLRAAVARHPEVPDAWAQLADCLEACGDVAGAIDALQQTLRLDRANFLGSRYQLAYVLIGAGRPAQAAELMRERVAEAPDDSMALRILARAQRHLGETGRAIALYRDAIATGADAETRRDLGVLLAQGGDLDGGIAELTAAARLSPDYADAWYSLGVMELQRGRHAEAVAAFERCATLGVSLPTWPTPPDQVLRTARQGAGRDEQLLRIAQGIDSADSPADSLEAARWSARRGDLPAASRLFTAALADARIAADLRGGVRREAARAVLGAVENSADVPGAAGRALTLLEQDLDAWSRVLASDSTRGRAHLRATLASWQEDAGLAAVRDAARLCRLSAPERTRCHALWQRVQELLDRTR